MRIMFTRTRKGQWVCSCCGQAAERLAKVWIDTAPRHPITGKPYWNGVCGPCLDRMARALSGSPQQTFEDAAGKRSQGMASFAHPILPQGGDK